MRARSRTALVTSLSAALSTLALALGLVGCAEPTVAEPTVAAAPPPARMAAIGTSLSVAYDSCGFGDCPQYSWSTGTNAVLDSHATRLESVNPELERANYAVAGTTAAGLDAQAAQAVAFGAEYVTVDIGANDACTPTTDGMTETATFTTQVQTALDRIAAGNGGRTRIFVSSIPNVERIWEVGKERAAARLIWETSGICQSMLARPTSTAHADVERRDAVQSRVDEYNAALQQVCAATPNCTWDGGTVADYRFVLADMSTLDYFHPSIAGQRKLAALTWPKTPFGS
ncbi:GDSL-type esterase/lipase family protein [Agromyces seonyuensis]|uniref:SGNH/GDSL hydrolase family protein n=1 Tax=Agromyces seonyuensis TaxID=2662446 RepID=A0A6I4NWF8_9MICO|nr:GDSL-type esterase/lipase family protein [Agromyces seonyuensis]MWB98610.1 SGNH/GDSL hydrolase family protein [Agromyces seonyuensis]